MLKPSPHLILVAAVLLVREDGKGLIARRPLNKALGGLWEFPGGKLEAGETPEAALVREIREELAVEIEAKHLSPMTFASYAYPTFHLLMPLYVCQTWQGNPTAQEGQTLAWVTAETLLHYDYVPADVPMLPTVKNFLARAV